VGVVEDEGRGPKSVGDSVGGQGLFQAADGLLRHHHEPGHGAFEHRLTGGGVGRLEVGVLEPRGKEGRLTLFVTAVGRRGGLLGRGGGTWRCA
jgi:hypothetical protein